LRWVVVALSGCSFACSPPAGNGLDRAGGVPRLDPVARLYGVCQDVPKSRGEALARLGQPLQVVAYPYANRHVRGQIDTVVAYRYERAGVAYWVSGAQASPREFKVDYWLVPPWRANVPLPQVATTRSIIGYLGREPSKQDTRGDTTVLAWAADSEATDYVQAEMVGDTLRRFRCAFYWD